MHGQNHIKATDFVFIIFVSLNNWTNLNYSGEE